MTQPDFQLQRNPFGQLVYTGPAGETHTGVVPMRAFPITSPLAGLSLMGPDGHELCWIANPAELPEDYRTLLETELAQREFMPRIQHIRKVSSYATPSTWTVATDKGDTHFILKGEEDLRRLGFNALIITDSHGVQYLLPDRQGLDRGSKKILERFL